jgi:hypothetical protein
MQAVVLCRMINSCLSIQESMHESPANLVEPSLFIREGKARVPVDRSSKPLKAVAPPAAQDKFK